MFKSKIKIYLHRMGNTNPIDVNKCLGISFSSIRSANLDTHLTQIEIQSL